MQRAQALCHSHLPTTPPPPPPPPPPPAAAPPHGTILLPSTSTTANTWPAVPMAAAPFTTSSLRLITAPLKRFRLVPNVARPPPSHRHRHPCSRLGRLPILRRKGVLLPSAHGHFQLVPAPRDSPPPLSLPPPTRPPPLSLRPPHPSPRRRRGSCRCSVFAPAPLFRQPRHGHQHV